MRAIIAFLALVSISATALNGQIYGEWDVPCALNLSRRFSAPFNHGVIYQSKEFVTPWRSVNQTPPLPSYNWYEPVPAPAPSAYGGVVPSPRTPEFPDIRGRTGWSMTFGAPR